MSNILNYLSPLAEELVHEQPFKDYTLLNCLYTSPHKLVFKAEDNIFSRPVVFKLILPSPTRINSSELFFSTARGIAKLRLSGISRGLNVGRYKDYFFYVSEFILGESLEDKLSRRENKKLTERESIFIIYNLVKVLSSLYKQGQTHRNLHLGNIFLLNKSQQRSFDSSYLLDSNTSTESLTLLKLSDLGFCWTISYPDNITAYHSKADYLSPEIINDDLNIDIRSDFYSLGCILYKLLTSHNPYNIQSSSDLLSAHLSSPFIPIRDIDPNISLASSKLLSCLLYKDRHQRPRTCVELLGKLSSHPIIVSGHLSKSSPSSVEDPHYA